MVDLMVACQEVQCRGGVSRSHGPLPAGSENQGPDPGSDPAVAGASMEPAASDPAVACAAMVPAASGPAVARAAEASRDDEIMEALAWSTGSRNEGVLVSLWEALPPWSIKEQVHEFRKHQLANRAKPAVAGGKLITIDFKKYWCRKIVSAEYHELLGGRSNLSNTEWDDFYKMVDWQGDKPKMARTPKGFRKLIKRWHASWRDDNHVVLGRAPSARGWLVGNKVRQRKPGFCGVHLQKVPLVKDQLYEWFLSMRYSIDWKRLNQEARSRGDRKAIGRFPQSLLELKL